MSRVAVIGAGSWGTALAAYSATRGHETTIWALEPEVAEEINSRHTNGTFLPDAPLPESLRSTNDIAEAARGARYIFSVVPTQFLRNVVKNMAAHIAPDATIISASKGIENETLKTPTEIYEEEIGDNHAVAAFGGPSFAKEVVREHPTVVVTAARAHNDAINIQQDFSSDLLRIYTSNDVLGVELCGATKNVIALASGAVAGMGFGDNTRAALITRGISEISRLVRHMGGHPATVAGMAGLGDMVLTCTSSTSRNYTVGHRLGSGESLDDIIASMKMVAEGVRTTKSVVALARREKVEMPISRAMHAVLYEGLAPLEAVRQLMTRELKHEWDSEAGNL